MQNEFLFDFDFELKEANSLINGVSVVVNVLNEE